MVHISEFPNEIIMEIFAVGCDSQFVDIASQDRYARDPLYRRPFERRPKEFAIPLTAVCSQWRTIVFGGSTYWVTEIYYKRFNRESFCHDAISAIKQSKGCDLDVSVLHIRSDALDIIDLLKVHILPNADRWRSFVCSIPNQMVMDMIWSGINMFKGLPRIIRFEPLVTAGTGAVIGACEVNMPKLHMLTLSSAQIPEMPSSFKSMTRLELLEGNAKPLPIGPIKAILEPSRSALTHLRLQFTDPFFNAERSTWDKPMDFPSLKTLSVSFLQFQSGLKLLSIFNLKSLDELNFSVDGASPTGAEDALPLSVDIPTLRVGHFGMAPRDLLSLFAFLNIPSLQTLTMWPRDFYHQKLTLTDLAIKFQFPKLNRLGLDWKEYAVNDESLSRFPSFFSCFDFRSAKNVRLTVSPTLHSAIPQHTTFPNAESLLLSDPIHLASVEAPILQRLSLHEPHAWQGIFLQDVNKAVSSLPSNPELRLRVILRQGMDLVKLTQPLDRLVALTIEISYSDLTPETQEQANFIGTTDHGLAPTPEELNVLYISQSLSLDIKRSFYFPAWITALLRQHIVARQSTANPLKAMMLSAPLEDVNERIWFRSNVSGFRIHHGPFWEFE